MNPETENPYHQDEVVAILIESYQPLNDDAGFDISSLYDRMDIDGLAPEPNDPSLSNHAKILRELNHLHHLTEDAQVPLPPGQTIRINALVKKLKMLQLHYNDR